MYPEKMTDATKTTWGHDGNRSVPPRVRCIGFRRRVAPLLQRLSVGARWKSMYNHLIQLIS
jgi:hypothetical protein